MGIVSPVVFESVRTLALSGQSRRRVACVLLRKGKVISSATNVEGKTHPIQAEFARRAGEPFRVSLHAEIRALIRAREAADTLVVGRVNRHGHLCLAKPCPVCQLAIAEAGIKQVYYSTNTEGEWALELPAGDVVE